MKMTNLLKVCFGLLLAIIMSGCIKEDKSGCDTGFGLRFRYVANIDRVDKFATDVDRIDIFVFDVDGVFLATYSDQGSVLDENYIMRLNLPPGRYTFVAWGNLADEHYLTQMIPGVTRFGDARLSLIRNNNTVSGKLVNLFHGMQFQVDVLKNTTNQIITIDLIKNNNIIYVIMKELPLSAKAAVTDFNCYITSANGDYRFDNTLCYDPVITYLPQTPEANLMVSSEFNLLRELNDGSTSSKLIIAYSADGAPPEEILNTDLTPLMINAPNNPLNSRNTGDLDIDDTYYLEIEFEFDKTNQHVTITVNGWIATPGGGVIIG